MDPMLEIPKNRKSMKVGRLCLLLAMVFILFIMLNHGRVQAMAMVAL